MAAIIDVIHLIRQRDWSWHTFGPPKGDEPTAGVQDHLKKELKEIAADPSDLEEWVDGILLCFDGAMRAGHEPQAVLDMIHFKQTKNEGRKWPDWTTAEKGKAIEHIRD